LNKIKKSVLAIGLLLVPLIWIASNIYGSAQLGNCERSSVAFAVGSKQTAETFEIRCPLGGASTQVEFKRTGLLAFFLPSKPFFVIEGIDISLAVNWIGQDALQIKVPKYKTPFLQEKQANGVMITYVAQQ
jgi:hypothetical protein